ncbi:uncharacterized protein MONOS_5785 [Monocercomonoides exilis]|uniref:uncharacterized protein n=1 Tax=Monocercomonoides exilis TaxID=2049356 RepID=UPI00355A7DD9|nr:hypothetical protein MONOS_5785 [Monocercomonoides exilis]
MNQFVSNISPTILLCGGLDVFSWMFKYPLATTPLISNDLLFFSSLYEFIATFMSREIPLLHQNELHELSLSIYAVIGDTIIDLITNKPVSLDRQTREVLNSKSPSVNTRSSTPKKVTSSYLKLSSALSSQKKARANSLIIRDFPPRPPMSSLSCHPIHSTNDLSSLIQIAGINALKQDPSYFPFITARLSFLRYPPSQTPHSEQFGASTTSQLPSSSPLSASSSPSSSIAKMSSGSQAESRSQWTEKRCFMDIALLCLPIESQFSNSPLAPDTLHSFSASSLRDESAGLPQTFVPFVSHFNAKQKKDATLVMKKLHSLLTSPSSHELPPGDGWNSTKQTSLWKHIFCSDSPITSIAVIPNAPIDKASEKNLIMMLQWMKELAMLEGYSLPPAIASQPLTILAVSSSQPSPTPSRTRRSTSPPKEISAVTTPLHTPRTKKKTRLFEDLHSEKQKEAAQAKKEEKPKSAPKGSEADESTILSPELVQPPTSPYQTPHKTSSLMASADMKDQTQGARQSQSSDEAAAQTLSSGALPSGTAFAALIRQAALQNEKKKSKEKDGLNTHTDLSDEEDEANNGNKIARGEEKEIKDDEADGEMNEGMLIDELTPSEHSSLFEQSDIQGASTPRKSTPGTENQTEEEWRKGKGGGLEEGNSEEDDMDEDAPTMDWDNESIQEDEQAQLRMALFAAVEEWKRVEEVHSSSTQQRQQLLKTTEERAMAEINQITEAIRSERERKRKLERKLAKLKAESDASRIQRRTIRAETETAISNAEKKLNSLQQTANLQAEQHRGRVANYIERIRKQHMTHASLILKEESQLVATQTAIAKMAAGENPAESHKSVQKLKAEIIEAEETLKQKEVEYTELLEKGKKQEVELKEHEAIEQDIRLSVGNVKELMDSHCKELEVLQERLEAKAKENGEIMRQLRDAVENLRVTVRDSGILNEKSNHKGDRTRDSSAVYGVDMEEEEEEEEDEDDTPETALLKVLLETLMEAPAQPIPAIVSLIEGVTELATHFGTQTM